jgi:hypothetical protein
LDTIGKNQKKGFKHLSGLVKSAASKAEEALQTAQEASEKAEEAVAIAEDVRATAANDISKLQSQVSEQGKQIQELRHLITVGEGFHSAERKLKPLAPGDRLRRIKGDFRELLDKATLLECNFVMGKKKDSTTAATVADAVNILAEFFPGMKVTATQAPNAKTVRFHVDSKAEAKLVAVAVESRWAEFGNKGWWIREDVPLELRALENRAREFILAAKDSDPSRKTTIGYVSVNHGKILKDGREVLPLCFIPVPNGNNWSSLFPLFTRRVESLKGQDWLGQFEDNDMTFHIEWFQRAGLQDLANDCQAYAASKQRPRTTN